MEETLVRTLEEFDIIAGRVEGRGKTGVWIGKKKIASIGAAVRNWITFHGFALNVNTDMHYFDLIDPCGMPSSTMTSMKTIIDVQVDFDKVKDSVKRNFEDVFHVSLRTIDAQMLENQRLTMHS
jgi:lipoate-protein ligase B